MERRLVEMAKQNSILEVDNSRLMRKYRALERECNDVRRAYNTYDQEQASTLGLEES